MSEFDSEDDCAQHSDARMEKADKNEAFTHEMNSQLPWFFKKLTLSNTYMFGLVRASSPTLYTE